MGHLPLDRPPSLGVAIHAVVYQTESSMDISHCKYISEDIWPVLRCIDHPSYCHDRERAPKR